MGMVDASDNCKWIKKKLLLVNEEKHVIIDILKLSETFNYLINLR